MNPKNLRRLSVVHLVITLALFGVMLRLFQYQIVDRPLIVEQASKRIERTITQLARRGEIRDRNGVILAYTLSSSDLVVDKAKVPVLEPLLTAILGAYPGADQVDIKRRFDGAGATEVVLIEGIPQDFVDTVKAIQEDGVQVEERNKRIYPNGTLASQTLGFVGTDGNGLEGLEHVFDEWLSGQNGYIKTRTDEVGRKNAFAKAEVKAPVHGYTIYTTLDATIQYYAEKAIAEGLKLNNAKRASAIVQDARTGEILAIANTPNFDPNKPFEIPLDFETTQDEAPAPTKAELRARMWRNAALKDLYEPGSTFKILSGLIGLQEGVITKDSHFYCDGAEKMFGETVKCWYYPRKHEDQTVVEGFQDSCNFVFIRTFERLKIEVIYQYLKAFGMMERSGLEIPTAKPIVIPQDKATALNKAIMSFGHSISVTPMHVMNILQAVSNDGELLEPTIIKRVQAQEGNEIALNRKPSRGQVITAAGAREMREILETVVSEGSGSQAYIPGYRIGGKTGTAVKIISGQYSDDTVVVSSFAAIVPVDKPVFNILVVVDEPKVNIQGSKVAAPIAREIIYNTLQYLEVPSNAVTGSGVVVVPDLVGLSVQAARDKAHSLGLKLFNMEGATSESSLIDQTDATGGDPQRAKAIITKQYPISGALSSKENIIYISTRPVE